MDVRPLVPVLERGTVPEVRVGTSRCSRKNDAETPARRASPEATPNPEGPAGRFGISGTPGQKEGHDDGLVERGVRAGPGWGVGSDHPSDSRRAPVLLFVGAGILLSRTIALLAGGARRVLQPWVVALT